MNESIDTFSTSEKALELMKEKDIPATPDNYAVWYHYASGGNHALSEEIDKAVDKQVAFNEGMNNYLYNKYIATDERHEIDTHVDAKQLLSSVLSIINSFTGENSSYQEAIDGFVEDLESESTDDLKSMVDQIIDRTKSLKDRTEEINQKLSESRAEVEGLRQNLAEATHEAQRDFLTGVFNRKALDKMLDGLVMLASKQNTALTILMIDIDHFKQFNDTHGHLIGDEVLKMVAKLLTDTLKGRDIVARFGGEEFAVILPSTNIGNAMIVAENLRAAVASKELKRRDTGETIGQVTVSIGVASFRVNADTVPTLLKRADDALYASKEKGRNRVTIEEAAG